MTSSSPDDALLVEDLRTWFRRGSSSIRAVDGLDFRVGSNETVALVGESGCGKSVTALSIMGLLPPGGRIVSGRIVLGGRDLTDLPDERMAHLRGHEVAMVFQEPMTSLNPLMSVGEQIMEVVRYHLDYSKEQARSRAVDLLAMVGFPQPRRLLGEYPHRLSGGMRQRVMIAIALSCEPKLLIADEPTTALDVTIQAQILELLREISARVRTAILLITHDLAVVSEMADRVVVMYAGQAVESAPTGTLFSDPLHPYTRGLLGCIPSIDGPVARLESIRGTVPSPDALPPGCRFEPRCPLAFDRCPLMGPGLREVRKDHLVRCLLYDGHEAVRS